jgi:hypothetical protein
MKWAFAISLAIAFGTAEPCLQPQSLLDKTESPKQVVERYFRFEADGGRLTAEGWQKANAFWVHPSQRPRNNEVTVIYKNFSVYEPAMKGSYTAEVKVEFLPQGVINSQLRFTPSQTYKAAAIYRLVLTDKHWELGAPGEPPKEVTGPAQWLIDGIETTEWITVEAAIQYVTKMRDQTTESNIKSNGDRTLATLKHIH